MMLPKKMIRKDNQLNLIFMNIFDKLPQIIVTAEQREGPGRNKIDKLLVLEEKKGSLGG
jgi:hypothetical protein